jgi:hypothetical protein
MVEQLQQLLKVTWDGNLISKHYRDELVKEGLAARTRGFNIITLKGIEWLDAVRMIKR